MPHHGSVHADHRDAGHAEWAASVKTRLDEAILHLANGIHTPREYLPCAKYPHCLTRSARWPRIPEGFTATSVSDPAVMTFDGELYYGGEAEALMRWGGRG